MQEVRVRGRWIAPVLIFLMFLAAVVAYPFLPAEIPTHLDWRGRAGGWMARWPGAFVVPGVSLVILLLLRLLPVLAGGLLARGREPRLLSSGKYWSVLNLLILLLAALQGMLYAAVS